MSKIYTSSDQLIGRTPLLELKKINLTYQTLKSETEAIKDVSFKINQGEFISIVGPSVQAKQQYYQSSLVY